MKKGMEFNDSMPFFTIKTENLKAPDCDALKSGKAQSVYGRAAKPGKCQ